MTMILERMAPDVKISKCPAGLLFFVTYIDLCLSNTNIIVLPYLGINKIFPILQTTFLDLIS